MTELIDLSQELYPGMPVYQGMPDFQMRVHATHEQWEGDADAPTATPGVYQLQLGEHTGTHVDGLNHMARPYKDQSIDTMPLTMFYTEGICLDFSHKQPGELIEPDEIRACCLAHQLVVQLNNTVLFYTDHYRRTVGTSAWTSGPGLSAAATRWLGEQGIAAFGVETMSPGIPGVSNREVHRICGELGFTHYENLVNLHRLVGRGRFRFIGFPLRIRGGTGSPVRAVAVFDSPA